MRVDQPRNDELARRLDDLDAIGRRDRGRDPLDGLTIDEKIGDCRLMDVAVMVVDASAADQILLGAGLRGHEAPALVVALSIAACQKVCRTVDRRFSKSQ